MIIERCNLKRVAKAFSFFPSQLYDMETRGILPSRPRGKITFEWLDALVAWHRKRRGELPDMAAELLRDVTVQLMDLKQKGKEEL